MTRQAVPGLLLAAVLLLFALLHRFMLLAVPDNCTVTLHAGKSVTVAQTFCASVVCQGSEHLYCMSGFTLAVANCKLHACWHVLCSRY